MAKVYVKMPKTGLGNMLLVWANAIVFAKINGLEMITSSWWGFRWGAILRREKKKRLYKSYFNETPFYKRAWFKAKLLQGTVIKDPEITIIPKDEKKLDQIFFFEKAIRVSDLFGSIRNHHEFIEQQLFALLTSKRKEELKKYPVPVIGVHIRRGDFKMGNYITPLSYFIHVIKVIRECTGQSLPVTIFSDADKSELHDILQLSNITIAEDKADILDILLMSKSRFLILSKDSTFSYWAAFLSKALVIIHYEDWQNQIKFSDEYYAEIKWNDKDKQSLPGLESLIKKYILVDGY